MEFSFIFVCACVLCIALVVDIGFRSLCSILREFRRSWDMKISSIDDWRDLDCRVRNLEEARVAKK